MKIEESSVSPFSKKRAILATVFEVVSTILFGAFAFLFIYGILAAPTVLLLCLPAIALSFLFKVMSNRANVSFDYAVGDGTFVIGKIISNKKRKAVFELSAKDILSVTVVDGCTDIPKGKKTAICTANDIPPEDKVFLLIGTEKKSVLIEAGPRLSEALKNKSLY